MNYVNYSFGNLTRVPSVNSVRSILPCGVPFGDDHFNQLSVTRHKVTDLLQLLVRNRTRRRLHSFPEMCEYLRIDWICLGEPTALAKSRTWRGLTTATGSPAFISV
jgi:hypothetical protein